MHIKKEFISNILFFVSYSLLVFMFSLFAFSFIGFIFHQEINIFYPIGSLLISIGILFYLLKTQGLSKSVYVYSLLTLFLIFTVSIIFGNFFYDSSWDGRAYHQTSIILFEQGWNPVYDNIVKFTAKIYDTSVDNLIWVENYPKFVEIVQANIFVIFHKIEISKMTNVLSGFMLFGYVFYVLNKNIFSKINLFNKVLIALLIVLNPVFIAQVMTFYIDAYVYLYFMMLLFAIIDIETSDRKNLISFSIIIMSAVCLANVKLGGLLYVFLPIIIYSLYIIFSKQIKKLKHLGLSVIVIVALIMISGIIPYYTNIKQDRNPLYPLIGRNKIDVIEHCIPSSLYIHNNFSKFILSTFSRVDNFAFDSNNKHHIKVPFWVYKGELKSLQSSDIRICGFGVFWSGILVLSVILAFLIRYETKVERKIMLLVFAILILLSLANPYCWWERYAPHLWAIPIFITISTLISNNLKKFQTILAYVVLITMFVNIIIQIIYTSNLSISYKRNISDSIQALKSTGKTVKVYNIYDWGLIQKFKENNIKFKLVNEEYYKKHINDFVILNIAMYDNMFWDYKD